MKKKIAIIASLVIVAAAGIVALSQNTKEIKALLTGYEEVPVISTTGNAELRARISNDDSRIDYELSYADLQGTITQSHIHVGQVGVNGGISVWLCSNLASPPTPAGVQPCPAPPATITGTLTASNVVGPNAQGIAPGELSELIQAIRAGKTYVNIHSTIWPGGEVRSQIDPGKGDHH
jgi:hypothetical protein